jgi:hypothetical protein
MTAFILCLFFGGLGIHKFYEKKIVLGILYLFTFGLFGIGWLVDTIILGLRLFDTQNAQAEVLPAEAQNDYPNTSYEKVENHIVTEDVAPTPINVAKESKISKSIETPSINSSNQGTQNHIYFRVAGVSKKNDMNINIQTSLKDYVKEMAEYEHLEKYEGFTNKEILENDYEVFEYDIEEYDQITFVPDPNNPYDKNAIKIMLEDVGHIGYVPKGSVKEVKSILGHNFESTIKILGGNKKYVNLEGDLKTEKLTYGVAVDLYY